MSDSIITTSYDAATQKRGPSSVATHDAVPGTGEASASQTVGAPEQPAAIISKSLARYSAGERSHVDARPMMDRPPERADNDHDPVSGPSELRSASVEDSRAPGTGQLLAKVQAEFHAQAQMAVLAQANQMPNDAMPFSMKT